MKRIGYVLKRYPRVSETFILQEILGLERAGIPLVIFAIMDPRESMVHPDVARVRAQIHYLRSDSPADLARIAISHARLLSRSPRRYLVALRHVVETRRRTTDGLGLALKHFWEAGRLADLVTRERIDHLHAHFATNPTSLARFAQLLIDVPFSFTAHAKDIYTSDPARLAEKMAYSTFTATCTAYNAAFLQSLAREYQPAAAVKVQLIYHGVDSGRFHPRTAQQPGGRDGRRKSMRILSVGRLVPKKGHSYLIRACAQLKEKGLAFECDIYGTGPLHAELERLVRDLDLADNVFLKGARTQADLAAIYREGDAFALVPFIQENGDRDGLPNVLLEAMASGLPVVASDVSGIPELVVDEETGLLVSPQDETALAQALERLFVDPALRRRLANAGRLSVERSFSADENVAQLAGLFGYSADVSVPAGDESPLVSSVPIPRAEVEVRG